APVVQLLDSGTLKEARSLPAGERRLLALLATSHHSLFVLSAIADRVLEIEDVIGGAHFTVAERRNTVGFEPGDVFEARVISDGGGAGGTVFGKTFLFHPPDARAVVLDWVDGAIERGATREDILFQLSRHHIRWHRYGHIGA